MADDLRSRIMKEEENSGVLKTMVIFSLAMLFFPVFLYFFSKGVFFEGEIVREHYTKTRHSEGRRHGKRCRKLVSFLGMSSQDSYFYAAFVAIGTIHIILGLFVYAAFTEGTSTSVKKD